jgi:hypothetical protein
MTPAPHQPPVEPPNGVQTVNPTPVALEGPVEALDLAAIEERLKRATPGPWKWAQDYEYRHGEKHWCLYNPQNLDAGVGDGIRRTINHRLITLNNQPNYVVDEDIDLTDEEKARGLKWAYRSLDSHPDFQLIANAPTDIAALVAEVKRLRSLVGGFLCQCCNQWASDQGPHVCPKSESEVGGD